MMVKDVAIKKIVDVADKECPKRPCYWPRPNPGIFTQGQGYKKFGDKRDKGWLCGNREIRGCPESESKS